MPTAELTVTAEELAQFRSWRDDPAAFISAVVKINDPKGREIPFELRDYQIETLNDFLAHPIVCCLKARQIGMTTLACALALWLLLFRPNRFILVLSKNDEDSKKFLRRIKMMYQRLPDWVKALAPQLVGRWGVHEAEFKNGSIIFSATSSSDHGRGDTPTDVFLDEVGQMRNADDSWTALIPAVEAGGHIRLFGTAKGFRDWFHLKWVEWQDDPDVKTIFWPWMVVPGRDETWAKRLRRRLGEALFKREYPATAEEAFINSGANAFSVEAILEQEPEPQRRFQLLRNPGGPWFLQEEATHTDEMGLFVYRPPEADEKYLLSADPSEGLSTGDPSALQILRWRGNELLQSAVLRGRQDPDDFADSIFALWQFYGGYVLVERNNHGHSVCKRLKLLRCHGLVYEKNKAGLVTSSGSKAMNIADTRTALAEHRLEILDQRTIDELLSFQEIVKPNGNVVFKGTEHDDHVDSLCLAVGYATARTPEERPQTEPQERDEPAVFSLDWFQSRKTVGTSLI